MFVSNLKNISLMKLIRNFNYTTFKNFLFHSFFSLNILMI